MVDELDPEALATLIYTSGTTGPPKGVMLSHANLAWTATCSVDLIDSSEDDCSLSYLPLSHIAEQMFSIHAPITVGYPIYFAESIDLVAQNLQEVQPTVVFGVPRIWEKMHAKVSARVDEATGVRRRLLDVATRVGREVTELRNHGRRPGPFLALQHKIAEEHGFEIEDHALVIYVRPKGS